MKLYYFTASKRPAGPYEAVNIANDTLYFIMVPPVGASVMEVCDTLGACEGEGSGPAAYRKSSMAWSWGMGMAGFAPIGFIELAASKVRLEEYRRVAVSA